MGLQVCMGAMLQCSFGVAPSVLAVIPKGASLVNATSPVATAYASVSAEPTTARHASCGMVSALRTAPSAHGEKMSHSTM